MRKTKLSKILSFLLCFVMVATSIGQIGATGAYADTETAETAFEVVEVDPETGEETALEDEGTFITENGETTLKVKGATGDVQWQFYAEEVDTWVSIYGETEDTILLKYAKVANMLNDKDKTQIRCIQKDGDTVIESNAVDFELLPAEQKASFPMMKAAGPRATTSESIVTEEETPEFKEYTITITYELNGTTVGTPYIATVSTESNGKFTGETNVPEVVGYVPYLKTPYEGVIFNAPDENSDKYTIKLNFENVTENINIQVGYEPGIVNYKVYHYKQNVDNDEYGVPEIETLTGTTGTSVPDVQKDYAGFYALNYNHAEIAASGETVIEVYYDRYYYLMNFNLDGGYGVEPIYARYGADIGEVPTPTKPGYTFQGWSDGTNMVDALPTTMPSNNVTYTAVWKVNASAKVSVVFWGENPNDEGYSYLQTGVIEATPGSSYTFADGNAVFLICGKEEHSHTADCGPTCGKEEHTTHTEECLGNCTHGKHKLDCYETEEWYCELKETNKPYQLSATHEGIQTYTTDSGWGQTTHYYLYLDGVWYCCYYNNYKMDKIGITQTCNHTHTDACYSCEEHEHSAACYSCKMEEHIHDSSCNQTGSGLDTGLWKFVRSETATVNADGSTVINVYYDRVEYTINFYSNSSLSNEYTNYRITAKWGASILNQWPTHNGSSSWYVPNKDNTWQNSIQIMPVGGAKFYGPKTGSSSYKAYYYVEALPGDTDTFVYNGVTYKLHHTDTSSSSGNVSNEERYAIEGFTYKEGTENGQSYDNAKFYYVRHNYAIEFYSPTTLLKKTENVPYESSLSSYNWTPDASQAPAKYEPGSVEFAGWYLNPECTGDPYDFNATTSKMPAGDNDGDTTLILYAKWVPITHTVQLYTKVDDIDDSDKMIGQVENIPHGSIIAPIPDDPTNGNYNFVGWFYDDNGVEKAFDFNNMPIKKDMKVYGKWSSDKIMNYFVYYRVDNGDGTFTEIADKTVGSALAGSTKTFEAKASEDLYEAYQSGYFPTLRSDSITMNIDASQEEPTDNSLIFWYVKSDPVPYTVRYLIENEDGTFTPLFTNEDGSEYKDVYDDNMKAVVTATFKVKPGYMPDAYQKRLTVIPGEENVITFIYTKDTENAYYKISHWVEDLDGGWTEYGNGTQAPAKLGTIISDENQVLTINGFHYDSSLTEVVVGDTTTLATSGELTADGLELKLYYPRNTYDYLVKYVDAVTGQPLLDSKLVKDNKYGKTVTEDYVEIDGYDCDAEQKSHVIKVENLKEDEVPSLNVITFKYTEQTVTINYVVDGPMDCGTVDLNNVIDEKTTSVSEENIQVLHGTVKGANAEANDDYTFIGWYDADGKKLSEDATYVPEKVNGKNVAATYYAKFVENKVTINYAVVGPDGCGTVSPESETVEVLTGNAAGSTAATSSNIYKFAGWYSDADCINKVANDVHFTPAKVDGKNVAATYYAKFEYNITNLTIAKTGFDPLDHDPVENGALQSAEESQSAIFQITGPNGYSQKVVIHGNTSVTIENLLIGTYTVTEVSDWAWRYDAKNPSQTITLQPPTAENKVTFVNERNNPYWLNGGAYNINQFKINQ